MTPAAAPAGQAPSPKACGGTLLACLVFLAVTVGPTAPRAAPCPGGDPDALGTERVLAVDARTTPRVGRKQFPATLALADKEVVLTFDDGPWPGTTPRVLDALRHECVRATFFLLGQNAAGNPALVRRELAEGHTVASHTYSHPLLDRMPPARAQAEIERGIAAVDTAATGGPRRDPVAPFFRFPGFASTPALLDWLAASSSSAPTCGRATGTRCLPKRSCGWCSAGSKRGAAASYSSMIRGSRPRRCCRYSYGS